MHVTVGLFLRNPEWANRIHPIFLLNTQVRVVVQ